MRFIFHSVTSCIIYSTAKFPDLNTFTIALYIISNPYTVESIQNLIATHPIFRHITIKIAEIKRIHPVYALSLNITLTNRLHFKGMLSVYNLL